MPFLSNPPVRADHVGSLLRPAKLRDAFKRRQANQIDATEFGGVLDEAIRDVVRLQEGIGFDVVTDGEFRRASYWGRFVERTDGFEIRPAAFKFHDDRGHEIDFTTPYAVGKIGRSRPLAVDEFAFLVGAAKALPKVTIPAPSSMHIFAGKHYASPAIYGDLAAFFDDLAKVYQAEIAALVDAGCTYIQMDEVALAMLCDETVRTQIAQQGQDPDGLVDTYIDAINAALAKRPKTIAVGVHVCRGNFKGHYLSGGGYDRIAERFFSRTDATHFLLEYDTPRAGDFAPLRFIPKSKGVVLGLLSSKDPHIESLDLLKRRVDEASTHIDVSRLGISPQCGFASTVAGNPVTEADERAKLTRVVEAARSIWGHA
ncbi:MAG: 5-methyltetrahydropteroyltriglutamate--homocysteine S-methyltransferase [Xanthobacteraceae bacterium]